MRISIREAFLGKRRLQDYGPKSNNWVQVTFNGEFNPEIADSAGLKWKERREDKKPLSLAGNSIYIDSQEIAAEDIGYNFQWGLAKVNSDFYYRPEVDLLLLITDYNRKELNVEAVLNYLANMSLEEIASLNNHKLPEECIK